jgi:hypothetical protein
MYTVCDEKSREFHVSSLLGFPVSERILTVENIFESTHESIEERMISVLFKDHSRFNMTWFLKKDSCYNLVIFALKGLQGKTLFTYVRTTPSSFSEFCIECFYSAENLHNSHLWLFPDFGLEGVSYHRRI